MNPKIDLDRPVFGSISIISGNVGHGKNTLAVGIVRVMSKKCVHNIRLEKECELCKKYGITQEERKLRVYSNFDIHIPDVECYLLKSSEDFCNIPKSNQHSLAILDEPNAFGFDSSHRNEDSREIGYKIQHCRHYNMDVLILTQLNSMVDLRGKRLSSWQIFAVSPNGKYFMYAYFSDNDIIPLYLSRKEAKKYIFPYFDTSEIIHLD